RAPRACWQAGWSRLPRRHAVDGRVGGIDGARPPGEETELMDRVQKLNLAGLSKGDYAASPSTLCKGCGHNSIASQIIQVCYDLSLRPQDVVKLSGIGCFSKSPAYFLGQSHGFNSLHGRMPSLGTGALQANHRVRAIGISGDGDTGSIGLGQF